MSVTRKRNSQKRQGYPEALSTTLGTSWKKNEIVIKKKKYRGTTLYRLNPDSEIVNHLGKLMDKKTERKKVKA